MTINYWAIDATIALAKLRLDDCRIALSIDNKDLTKFTRSFALFSLQKVIFLKNYSSVLYVSNNKTFFVMFSRNKCKLIRRRYDNVDLILNNWEFIMYDLREQTYWVCSWRWCLCSLQTSSSWVKSMSRCLYLVAHSTSTIDCSLAFWTISTSSKAFDARARKSDASSNFHLCSMRDASKSIDQEHESLTSRSR